MAKARGAKIERRAVGPAWLWGIARWTVEQELFRDAVVVKTERCGLDNEGLQNLR
ncbi:MAG: hypothetical protein KJZ87_07810 [Thermoguttaceae bacterium]|nr:hypothetical protein [Thermoguttaceae bacterium]